MRNKKFCRCPTNEKQKQKDIKLLLRRKYMTEPEQKLC